MLSEISGVLIWSIIQAVKKTSEKRKKDNKKVDVKKKRVEGNAEHNNL